MQEGAGRWHKGTEEVLERAGLFMILIVLMVFITICLHQNYCQKIKHCNVLYVSYTSI